jgi:hypothetical protein
VPALTGESGAHEESPTMKKGALEIAMVGERPTLDIQMSMTILTYEIMWYVFESLFTYDHAQSDPAAGRVT